MIEMLKKIVGSRKWMAMVVGFLLPLLNAKFGWNLSEETVMKILGLIAVTIGSEAYIDGKRVEGVPPPPPIKPT